jgi:hypothetical protein
MRRTATRPDDPGVAVLDRSYGERPTLHITLVVAPATGRFVVLPPGRLDGGSREAVEEGQPLARVVSEGRAVDVLSPAAGWLGGILCRNGEPVTVGQGVAWVVRSGSEGATSPEGRSGT